MIHMSRRHVAVSVLLLSAALGADGYTYSRVNPGYDPRYLLRRDDQQPNDFSVIQAYTAIGDSFAAGLGAGIALDGSGDKDCSRYDTAYPVLVNSVFNEEGAGSSRTFTFLACSQATTSDVSTQIDEIADNSQDLVTISAGGNDVQFATVLKKCVYLPYTDEECTNILAGAEYAIETILRNSVDAMLDKLDSKMKAGSIVVYSLYARFFNAATEGCNDKSWSFFDPVAGNGPLLTQDKRQRMNNLVDSANKKLLEAIASAGGSSRPRNAKYIAANYDNTVGILGGRFCEDTTSQDSQYKPESSEMFQRLNVAPYVKDRRRHVSRARRTGSLDERSVELQAVEDGKDLRKRLPDSLARVFHPNEAGHSVIAQSVIGAWVQQRALDLSWDGTLPDTCRLGDDDDDNDDDDNGGDDIEKTCVGAPSEAPWNSKSYVTRDAAAAAADDFCGGDLTGDTQKDYNEGENDSMRITLVYSGSSALSADDCKKAIYDVIDGCDMPDVNKAPPFNPFNWKYGGTSPLPSSAGSIQFEAFNHDHIDRVCNGNDYSKYVDDATAYDLVSQACAVAPRGPEAGTLDFPAFEGTPEELSLVVNVPAGGLLSEADCNMNFTWLIDACDAGPNNPMNWKHGGTQDRGGVHLEVVPKHERRMPEPYYPDGRCESWYKFWYAEFKVWGSSYSSTDFGDGPGGLHAQLAGCGAITAWHFEYFATPDGAGYEWYASGTLPIGTRGCVGRAMHSAGGPDKGCDGNG